MTIEPSYQVKDIVGFDVITKDGEVLGQLEDVLPSGANDIFVVGKEKKEILIPALKSVVLSVDKEKRQITVDLPTGLKEIYIS